MLFFPFFLSFYLYFSHSISLSLFIFLNLCLSFSIFLFLSVSFQLSLYLLRTRTFLKNSDLLSNLEFLYCPFSFLTLFILKGERIKYNRIMKSANFCTILSLSLFFFLEEKKDKNFIYCEKLTN